jgi:hypothetical protein
VDRQTWSPQCLFVLCTLYDGSSLLQYYECTVWGIIIQQFSTSVLSQINAPKTCVSTIKMWWKYLSIYLHLPTDQSSPFVVSTLSRSTTSPGVQARMWNTLGGKIPVSTIIVIHEIQSVHFSTVGTFHISVAVGALLLEVPTATSCLVYYSNLLSYDWMWYPSLPSTHYNTALSTTNMNLSLSTQSYTRNLLFFGPWTIYSWHQHHR